MIDRFNFFEDEPFFYFLEVEHVLEKIGIPQFQKIFKIFKLFYFIEVSVSFEMVVKLFIEESFSVNVLRHDFICVLNEIYSISYCVVIMKLEYFLYGVVKGLL